MKIIERGTNTIKCQRCGCIMEYDKCDIKSKMVVWSFTSPVMEDYIECPQCGKEICIDQRCK